MSKLQLFVLLQDTIAFIQHGHHLAPNYAFCKNFVLKQYGLGKRTNAKKLLVCIGDQYHRNGWMDTFEEYMLKCDRLKFGIINTYNVELDKMAED